MTVIPPGPDRVEPYHRDRDVSAARGDRPALHGDPYYIAPEDRVAQEAFAVIREAMRDSNKAVLGPVVLGRRERVVMIEPWKKGLLATLLRYGYEVRDDAAYFEDIPDLPINTEMRDLAEVIVHRKSGHFDPTEFEDRYENALIDLMRHKQAGTPVPAPAVSRPANVVNLMDALHHRSVAAEKAADRPRRSSTPSPSPPSPPGTVRRARRPRHPRRTGFRAEEIISRNRRARMSGCSFGLRQTASPSRTIRSTGRRRMASTIIGN